MLSLALVLSLGQTTRAAVSPRVDPVDHRDAAYCEMFLAPSEDDSDQRFDERDPAAKVMADWLALAESPASTWKSLSIDQELKRLESLRFALVAGFVEKNLANPRALTLHQLYVAYLNAYWVQLTWYRRVENPRYFDDAHGRVDGFEEFRRRRLAAFVETYPTDVSLADTLTRVWTDWIPKGRRPRFERQRALDERAGSSLLGDVILGMDPIAIIRSELKSEVHDDHRPTGVGMHREQIFTDYAPMRKLWDELKLAPKQTVVDLAAGVGRAGLSLAAHKSGVRYRGFERLGTRARAAQAIAEKLGLRTAEFSVDRQDVAAPAFDLPPADVYILPNAFVPTELERLFAKFAAKARSGDVFKIVMPSLPLFEQAALIWPEEFSGFDRVFPKLPRELRLADGPKLKARLVSHEEQFFVITVAR